MSKAPLPKLVMIPKNGEYHIIPIMPKLTWWQVVMKNAVVWLTLLAVCGFALNVIYMVHSR